MGYSMNFDYIEISKAIRKDSVNMHYLQLAATYPDMEKYFFDGCERLSVCFHTSTGIMKVKGSLPYWLNGHNYFSSLDDWKEGLEYLGGCLCVNLFSGDLVCFEYGTILEVPFPAPAILQNHIRLPRFNPKEYRRGNVLTGKEFTSPALKVKLYDANRNMKNKLSLPIREDLQKYHGWNPAKPYIKVELHYKQPEAMMGGIPKAHQIFDPVFQNWIKNDLLTHYQAIMKTGKVNLPTKKGISMPEHCPLSY
jgi:hypothetical protein